MEKKYVLSLSYGKDSLACLGAIEKLGWQLDRIVHAEVWATDTISADLPPMMEFKKKADKIIYNRWGIKVEHFQATKNGEYNNYEKQFYQIRQRGKEKKGKFREGCYYGFPCQIAPWCNSKLKVSAINLANKSCKDCIQYIGIAVDEPKRFKVLSESKLSPLKEIGWTEADCYKWCKENELLSPIYETSARGGCWFCHNQSVEQLRLLRKDYPDYWNILLKWDNDSPVSFKADGHTVHDYEKRFQAEDNNLIPTDKKFRWKMLKNFE